MGQLAVIDRAPQTPAFTLSDMERIATSIARGGMFGSKDPHAVLTLCMLAQAEGQHPAVVFRDYDIIQGKPAKKAEAMLRDFINSGGKVTWNRLDDECADATFSHPQGGEVTINWTMARAQKAQLGGKDMWKKYPRQMLRSRVVSEGVRTVCPNATSGLYVPEEVRDFDAADRPDTPATPQPQRARDLKAEKPEPQQIEDKSAGRAKAEEWTEAFVANPEATPANERAMTKLEREHPDLFNQAKAALDAAREPATGNPDEGRGENTDDHPAAAKRDELIAAALAVANMPDLNSLRSDSRADVDAMPNDMAEAVLAAFDAAYARLKDGAE